MRSYLVLAINAKLVDINFQYTECDITKLLQESVIEKSYVNI